MKNPRLTFSSILPSCNDKVTSESVFLLLKLFIELHGKNRLILLLEFLLAHRGRLNCIFANDNSLLILLLVILI